MLTFQYINDFNKSAGLVKFLSPKSVMELSNKLKLIRPQALEEDINEISTAEYEKFLDNIFHVLCQSTDIQSSLLDNCLEILLISFNCKNREIKNIALGYKHFLSMLIPFLVHYEEDNDELLVKLLKVIREFLTESSNLDEHNLRLIVEALRDCSANHLNEEVVYLSITIMANLCLQNCAAKYLITRAIRLSKLKEKITAPSSLIFFKLMFFMTDDDTNVKDFKFFLQLGLKDIRAGLKDFNFDPLNHSLDILEHFKRLQFTADVKFDSEEELTNLLKDLTQDLLEVLSNKDSIIYLPKQIRFFNGIFKFFKELINLDSGVIELLDAFNEVALLSPDISRTASSMQYFSSHVNRGGNKPSSEIVIEQLLEHFSGDTKEITKVDYDQNFALFQMLEVLEAKDKLSEPHLQLINTYFRRLVNRFHDLDISEAEEKEVFLFIYFLSSLSTIAKGRIAFHVMMDNVLKLDTLPLLIVKGFMTKKKEILMVLLQLSNTDNFPNEKIASVWSNCSITTSLEASDGFHKNLQKRDNDFRSARLINSEVNSELDLLIQRINEKLDKNDMETSTANVVECYRQKINFLNYQLTSLSSSIEMRSAENMKQRQMILTMLKQSERQEFKNWSLQLDRERMSTEFKDLRQENSMLKKTLSQFQVRMDKIEDQNHKSEKLLMLKVKEIKQINDVKEQAEQKLRETKAKLHVAQEENETRINELKESLESDKKSKDETISKLNQKITTTEKESQKRQEFIKIQEKNIIELQEKIHQCEGELKEAEQMKNTIMSLMSARSFKK